MATDRRPPSVLTIAGSDSGGGAGIQADLKTFAAHRVHGLSAIAALTAQHTRGVAAVHVPDADFLRAQLDACFEDFDVRAVKIGMLGTRGAIEAVAGHLRTLPAVGESELDAQRGPLHRRAAGAMPVVIDPVMIATSGARLLDDDALAALRALLPLAAILTPNIPEAELLLDRGIADASAAERALHDLQALTGGAVLLKGAHLDEGERVVDRYGDADGTAQFVHPRLPIEGHGTGCTLASAIAANLALGRAPRQACERAIGYVARALRGGYRPGLGQALVLDHIGAARPVGLTPVKAAPAGAG